MAGSDRRLIEKQPGFGNLRKTEIGYVLDLAPGWETVGGRSFVAGPTLAKIADRIRRDHLVNVGEQLALF